MCFLLGKALCAGAPDSIVSGEIDVWFAQAVDSERELAAACARGDEGAWLELIRRYDRTIVRVL